MNLRNIVLAVLGFAALLYGGRMAIYQMASPEDQIRGRFEAMARGFNRTVSAGVLDGFAEEYQDDRGTDRDGVRDILLYLFFQEYSAEGGGRSLRVEFPSEQMKIELAPEEGVEARVELQADFFEIQAGEERPYWAARGFGELVDRGSEWEIVRTYEPNHSDRR